MGIVEKTRDLLEDSIFWLIFLSGSTLSFIISVNQSTFSSFQRLFLAGISLSLILAGSWCLIERKNLRIAVMTGIFLFSGIYGLHVSSEPSQCLGWFAESSQNPVTGQCQAFVYGGCGPTPEPWYYKDSCTTQAKEEMCGRLAKASGDESETLHSRLCVYYPKINLSVVEYDSGNETLRLKVTESTFNLSNTGKLRIEPWENRSFRIKRSGKTYNTSVLIAQNEKSVFNGSLNAGDEFTVVYDGTDFDGDGRKGVDFKSDPEISYVLEWWNSELSRETDIAVMFLDKNRSVRVSHIYRGRN